jgi:ferredoxin
LSLVAEFRVWIDQDLCTGDGLCVDRCPQVFVLLEDGISYVHDGEWIGNDPGQWDSMVSIPEELPEIRSQVIEAAEVCPGECIFIEVD